MHLESVLVPTLFLTDLTVPYKPAKTYSWVQKQMSWAVVARDRPPNCSPLALMALPIAFAEPASARGMLKL